MLKTAKLMLNRYGMKLTVDNICDICEKQGTCNEPCSNWYDCFEGKPVEMGLIVDGE